jgi:uncharacterized phage protein (TIGR02220 family)
MSKDQKGFVVYGDIEESLNELSDEQVATLFRGMVSYFNTGKDPGFNGLMKMVFIPIRQQMDRDTDKYEKKCKKNKESIQNYWDKVKADTNEYERIRTYTNEYERIPANTNVANTKTKTNTDKKTDKDADTMSVPDASSLSSDLISYLNDKAGTSHKPTKTVVRQIQGLLDNGYTPFQIRTVIDKKCDEWLNDSKMRGYLRPSTLFGDKFDEYLSAPVSLRAEAERKRTESIEELRKRLEEKRTAMASISEAIEELRGDDGKFGDNLNEFRVLWDQKAILEDSIKQIEKRLEDYAN